MNPMVNSMRNAMREVIKTKMRSALCDEDQMAEVKRRMYEQEEYSYIKGPMRSAHPDIPPPEDRIKAFKTKQLKHLGEAYDQVKANDAKLIQIREDSEGGQGLLTANLGSVYDIPASMRDDQSMSTKASTKITSTTQKEFRQTEGA